MRSARWPLVLAYLAAGVFLILFTFIMFLGGNRIGFLYSRVPGFNALRNVLQWAGIIASLGFLVAGALVAIPIALARASWPHKVLAVLPVLLLLFALGGILVSAAGIGAVGQMGAWPLLGPVTFASGWLALGTVLAVAAVVIAVAVGHIGPRAGRAAGFGLGVTSLAGIIAAVAMIGMLVLVANNQPSLPRFNRDGQQAALPGAGAAQQGEPRQGQRFQDQGQNQGGFGAGGGEGNFGGDGGGRPFQGGGGEGEGGFGPAGGGLATIRQQFTNAGVLLVVAALVEVFSTLAVLAAGRAAAGVAAVAADASAASNVGGHGAGGTVLAGIGVVLVAFGLIQLVPAQRRDPPVQSTIQWDTPQTQQLWQRACADCHSNQTRWPWYTAIAPGSWLIAGHVNAGRQSLNVSELGGNAGFRRAPRAGEATQQIRSGAMPPADYLLIHPDARLTQAEKQQLIQGLQNTFGR